MTTTTRAFAFIFSLLVGWLAAPAVASAQTTLKVATLAPDGSSWMKLFREFGANIEKRTEGRVKVKFYPGGVQGDERDVLRKMKLGQLAGAAITGIGLSMIHPAVRVLELARSYEELDALRSAFGEQLKKQVADKGYVLVNWGDVGPIHIFANRPVKGLEDLRQTKMWMWSDDPVSRQFFDALEIRGVPMGVPDVLPGLSTGAIDAFLGAPLPTLALQWGTKVKYMSSLVIGQATGATVFAKKVWDTLTPDDQKVVLEEAHAAEVKVLAQGRSDNAKALEQLKSRGLEVVATSATLGDEIAKRIEVIAKKQGEGVDPAFRQEVEAKVKLLRAKK
jgi:TRAP-type C4-dicarboxylate transport system substrate-binding protein